MQRIVEVGCSTSETFDRCTCKICGNQHGGVKVSEKWTYLKDGKSKRWEMAKQQKLCYQCLGDNHHGVALRVEYVEQNAVVTLTTDYCTKIEVNQTRIASNRNWQQFNRMPDQLVWIKINREFHRQ